MPRFKKAAVMFTAVESARQWARSNPDKASQYIDKATGFVDQRTHGRYHRQIDGFSSTAKKNLTGRRDVSGTTVRGETDQGPSPSGDGRR